MQNWFNLRRAMAVMRSISSVEGVRRPSSWGPLGGGDRQAKAAWSTALERTGLLPNTHHSSKRKEKARIVQARPDEAINWWTWPNLDPCHPLHPTEKRSRSPPAAPGQGLLEEESPWEGWSSTTDRPISWYITNLAWTNNKLWLFRLRWIPESFS